ncbi:MAG: triphosphoribosyl-dephospho-CoA synthase [Desulfurococcales archaeon]|nr:triphosphoribosyl-dephospho-CoA synthase [Desulfurococcales archaeon]
MSGSLGSRSSTYVGSQHNCKLVGAIISGLFLEPIIHPKPGAVTRLRGHSDKDVVSFVLNNSLVSSVLFDSCMRASRGDLSCIYGNVFKKIAVIYKNEMKTNTSMGSWLLHIPLTVSLGFYGPTNSKALGLGATRLLRSLTTECDTHGYYEFLSSIRPSHLGRLIGRFPDALNAEKDGLPRLWDILVYASSSDIVHAELVRGYSESIRWSKRLAELSRDNTFEDAASRVFLEMLASTPDTLIRRKFGTRTAVRIMEMAKLVLKNVISLDDLDRFMRRNGYNAGSLLDILSVSISLFIYQTVGHSYL